MLVSFPFTFKLAVPGLPNPFSAANKSHQPDLSNRPEGMESSARTFHPSLASSPFPIPSSRKRGWDPSFAEPSQSTTTLASTSGYLDTPAKYRDMLGTTNQESYHEVYTNDQEMPPVKRRRGLAGSIVSTALSAALIGTAVGLTVYRLWRDRGKQPQQLPPPPPYQQGEWTPVEQHPTQPKAIDITPTTPPPRVRKPRHPNASAKRVATTQRRARVRPLATPPRMTSPALHSPVKPEFNFASEAEPAVEDQMDWIGDKLSILIEQGKRALGSEVVVMSDAQEDEVDDGTGQWEEDNTPAHAGPSSLPRASPTKRARRSRSFVTATPSHPMSASPRLGMFDHSNSSTHQTLNLRRTHSRGISVESALPSSFEDESAWQSPEIRASMAQARARLIRNQAS